MFFLPEWRVVFALGFVSCVTDTPDSDDTDLPDEPVPAVQVSDWCEASAGGVAGTRPFAQDFARAHVGQRVFGPTGDWRGADEHLVSVLNAGDGVNAAILDSYAGGSEDLCVVPANQAVGRAARVESTAEQGVYVIRPGVDVPALPEDTQRVIVDLRDLHPDADVDSLVGQAVGGVELGVRQVRKMLGFPSQEDGWTHYESSLHNEGLTFVGTTETELPLIFWTGQRLTPEVAFLVGGLRLRGKAAIIGYDVHSAVAEATWAGLESDGLLWRSGALSLDGSLWPDVIPADISTSTPEFYVENTPELAPIEGVSNRSPLANYERAAGQPAAAHDRATQEAALLVAYGTLDWFYPYFAQVGRGVDDALLAELETVGEDGELTRADLLASVGRLMHAVHDGHGYVYDWAGTDWPDGYLAIQLHQVGGEPMVRVSNHEGVNAGDVVVSVDGVAAADWYAEAESRVSASSDGYAFVMASDMLKEVRGTRTLGLRNVDGVERVETLHPKSWSDLESVPWGGTFRDNGWLTDLGAPNVYYVNLSGSVTPDEGVVTSIFDTLSDAEGMVLDMRDYPNLDIYGFAGYFQDAGYTAPWFDFPTWTGPDHFEWTREIWSFSPYANPYMGPVVLLVSPYSVSAAECFSQMLVGLDHVTVMGQQSASTNGTITNLWLPGEVQIYFTGMRLLNLDGSDFHGIGIQPDVMVTPTAAEFAAGIDPELERALDYLVP